MSKSKSPSVCHKDLLQNRHVNLSQDLDNYSMVYTGQLLQEWIHKGAEGRNWEDIEELVADVMETKSTRLSTTGVQT